MHILLGLGNPGSKYDRTPHNIGFDATDRLADSAGGSSASTASAPGKAPSGTFPAGAFPAVWKSEHKSLTRKITVAGIPLLIAKPQTFMNLSGEAAQSLMAFYKVSPKNLIVVMDDIYLDIGAVRIRTQGSAGGHNGLKSMLEHCGDAFTRIRIGVGPVPPGHDRADYVLRKYGVDEAKILDSVVSRFRGIIETGLTQGWERAGSEFNRRSPI